MIKFAVRFLPTVTWVVLLILSGYFFIYHVAIYFSGYRSTTYQTSPFWVTLHLVGGSFPLFLGPFQFLGWLRKRYLALHRLVGKIYIIGAGIAGISALRLSLLSSCRPCSVSLFILSVLVLITTFLAWWTIRRRNIKLHRQFMVRSYICIFSFVAVRLGELVSLDFLFGRIDDPTFNRTVNEYFFSFVPLIIGEIFLTWWPSLRLLPHKKKQAQVQYQRPI